jgi:hypothetical protein
MCAAIGRGHKNPFCYPQPFSCLKVYYKEDDKLKKPEVPIVLFMEFNEV